MKKGLFMDKYKKQLAFLLLASVLCAAALLFCLQVLGVQKWKDLEETRLTGISESLRIVDANGNLLLNTGVEKRTKISLAVLPDYVKYAFISAEDVRFYSHGGLDLKRIFGSLWADIRSGSYKEGASTISMQLIKNSMLTNDKTMARKLQEALLACQLESRYSKDEILEMYLNFIYFGKGAYGIQAAAQCYFSKDASALTLDEAALLAGVIKSPARFSPHIKPENAVGRRNVVLGIMKEEGYITQEEYEKASKKELVLRLNPAFNENYGYAVDAVMQEACRIMRIDMESLLSGGYTITTGISAELQNYCEQLYQNSDNFPAGSGGVPVQSAMVLLDNKTNNALAVLGGRSYDTRLGLNRALQMRRPPGSTAKPFVAYGAGLESGLFSPATIFVDQRKSFNGYTPSNFGDKYYGKITLRQALARSLNVPAVEALQRTGVDKAKAFAKGFGIPFDSKDDNLALALGGFTYGVTPMELANGYMALANGGQYAPAGLVLQVAKGGSTLYTKPERRLYACSAETAYLLTDMLQDASLSSVGSRFTGLPYRAAAKTGTVGYPNTDGYMDAWIATYTPEYTIVVWMGYDQTTREHFLQKGVTGSTYPASIAVALYEKLYAGSRPAATVAPKGIVKVRLDEKAMENAEIAVATSDTPSQYVYTELFNSAFAPSNTSPYWCVPDGVRYFSMGLSDVRQAVATVRVEQEFVSYVLFRRENGVEMPVARLTGKKGAYVSYVDTGALAGHRYEYYIVPQNRNTGSGEVLSGPTSQVIPLQLPG